MARVEGPFPPSPAPERKKPDLDTVKSNAQIIVGFQQKVWGLIDNANCPVRSHTLTVEKGPKMPFTDQAITNSGLPYSQE